MPRQAAIQNIREATHDNDAAFGARGRAGARHFEHRTADNEEAAVNQAIENLRKAMVDADKDKLAQLVSDQLSYGHSSGVLETKAQYIDVIASKKTIYQSINLLEPWSARGANAIVRRHLHGRARGRRKTRTGARGCPQVWQKQAGRLKLLARQAFRLPS